METSLVDVVPNFVWGSFENLPSGLITADVVGGEGASL